MSGWGWPRREPQPDIFDPCMTRVVTVRGGEADASALDCLKTAERDVNWHQGRGETECRGEPKSNHHFGDVSRGAKSASAEIAVYRPRLEHNDPADDRH